MDAFYASIEQRDFPEYKNKPLVVANGVERGVVAAASYESRKYGIRSAMPLRTALNKCPHMIVVPARFDVYQQVSEQVHSIFHEYTDWVEPLSLDEAYLDVTINHKQMKSATLIAKEIKQRIKELTSLTASAGVSYNKFLAKIASDYNKPDGLCTITPEKAEKFVEQLKIDQFYGVGKKTAEKMKSLGIYTGADLKGFSEEMLIRQFGKQGHSFYQFARAKDERLVEPNRIRKSIGAENTFADYLIVYDSVLEELAKIRERVWPSVIAEEFYGRTVTLKVKYGNFEQITRSFTRQEKITSMGVFEAVSNELASGVELREEGIRLLGLTISNAEDSEQLEETYRQLKIQFGPHFL